MKSRQKSISVVSAFIVAVIFCAPQMALGVSELDSAKASIAITTNTCSRVPNPLSSSWVKSWRATYGARLFDTTVIDLDTGCKFHAGYEGTGYPTASTSKVMIATQVLRNVDSGRFRMSSVYSDLELMIAHSDNAAGTRLYNKIGRNYGIQKVINIAHLTHTRPYKSWGTVMTTSGDQASLLRQLFVSKTLLHYSSMKYFRSLMHQVGDYSSWGIGIRRPSGWSALQKNGWYYSRPGIDTPPTGGWRINSLAVILDTHSRPRWIVTGYGDTFPTQYKGMRAWTILGGHVSAIFGPTHRS